MKLPTGPRLAKLAGIVLGSAVATLGAARFAFGRANPEPEQRPQVAVSSFATTAQPTISAPALTTADLLEIRRAIDRQASAIELQASEIHGVANEVHAVDGRVHTIEGYMQSQRDEKLASRNK